MMGMTRRSLNQALLATAASRNSPDARGSRPTTANGV